MNTAARRASAGRAKLDSPKSTEPGFYPSHYRRASGDAHLGVQPYLPRSIALPIELEASELGEVLPALFGTYRAALIAGPGTTNGGPS